MRNENKIYRLLNDMQIDVEDYEEIAVSFAEKEKTFQNLTAKKNPSKRKKHPALVFALLIMLFATAFLPPVKAAIQSILETIQYTLSDALGIDEHSSDGVVSIQQFDYIQDVGIKIEEVIYIGDYLIFNVLIDMEETPDDQSFMGFGYISAKIDGKTISSNGITYGNVINKTENIYGTVVTMQVDQELISSRDSVIAIEIDDIHYKAERITAGKTIYEGQANFEIQTSGEELSQFTLKYPLNEHFSAFDVDYHINELISHPLMTLIEIQSDNPSDDYQLMEIRGTDAVGRSLTFIPYLSSGSDNHLSMKLRFSEVDSEVTAGELYDTEALTLQFYSAGHPIGTDATYEPFGELFEVNLKMHAPE